MRHLPTYTDVLQAAQRLQGVAITTPLLSSPVLDELCEARVFLKAENLQRTGSFKFRGAYNAVSIAAKTRDTAKKCQVLAASSGNHAQGVAEAARLHELSATIVMPSDAPKIKIDRTARAGASIVFYDRINEDREEVSRAKADELGAVFLHPFDNPNVIAGQGTCALEACDVFEAEGLIPDRVLVCTGGGGLASGIALVIKERFPKARFHTVEPENFDDYRRSLTHGDRLKNEATSGSLCDAIITPQPGELSFALLNGYADEGLIVSDEEALAAVSFAFQELKIVLEPGGAVALAALLSKKISIKGETVLATLSGGNIDPAMMKRAFQI